jgi:hypothetical protein
MAIAAPASKPGTNGATIESTQARYSIAPWTKRGMAPSRSMPSFYAPAGRRAPQRDGGRSAAGGRPDVHGSHTGLVVAGADRLRNLGVDPGEVVVREFDVDRAGVLLEVRMRTSSGAHAVELAREGVPLIVVQRQLGHSNLGITSVYLQGIDNAEIIETVHARRQPMIPVSTSLRR